MLCYVKNASKKVHQSMGRKKSLCDPVIARPKRCVPNHSRKKMEVESKTIEK